MMKLINLSKILNITIFSLYKNLISNQSGYY